MVTYKDAWARGAVSTAQRDSVGQAGELLQANLHRAPGALAFGDDEQRVVARDGADGLGPPRAVHRDAQGLGRARGRLEHEEWADGIERHEQRGQQLLE